MVYVALSLIHRQRIDVVCLEAIDDPHSSEPGFDVYSIPDALDPEAPQDGTFFLNGVSHMCTRASGFDVVRCADPRTRAALHAPTSKNWSSSINYPFENSEDNFVTREYLHCAR
jgi:carboxypeptidase D